MGLFAGILAVFAVTMALSMTMYRAARTEQTGQQVSVQGWAGHERTRETAAMAKRTEELPEMDALYGIYVHQAGWSRYLPDNSYCMSPEGNYVTALRATLKNQPEGMSGTISYRVNLSGSGWLDWSEDAAEAGASAGEMPLEALTVQLTGDLSRYYDIHYSVLQDGAWTQWVKNGAEAGVSGAGLRIDGIRMAVSKKDGDGISYAAKLDPARPMVALTYDDGPAGETTLRILRTLKEHDARATFFMVGQRAEKNASVIRQMIAQDCEVANHTYDHKMMDRIDPVELTRQLELTNQAVADICGVSPVLMRPCGGARTLEGMTAVGAISMPAVLWSIDTLDWKTKDAQNTVQVVLSQVKDGDIILMHDLYEATADASEILIPELVSRGYQLVTVSELASYRGGMLPGKTYAKFRP